MKLVASAFPDLHSSFDLGDPLSHAKHSPNHTVEQPGWHHKQPRLRGRLRFVFEFWLLRCRQLRAVFFDAARSARASVRSSAAAPRFLSVPVSGRWCR